MMFSAALRERESEWRQASDSEARGVSLSRYVIRWARDMESTRKPTWCSPIGQNGGARAGICFR